MEERILNALVDPNKADNPESDTWLTEEQHLDHQRQLFHDLADEVGMEEAKERWDDWGALVEGESDDVPFPEEDWEQLLLDRMHGVLPGESATVIVIGSTDGYDPDEMKERLKAMGVPNP